MHTSVAEPEPLFYGGSGSSWIYEKNCTYILTGMLLFMRLAVGHKRTDEVTDELKGTMKMAKVTRGRLRS